MGAPVRGRNCEGAIRTDFATTVADADRPVEEKVAAPQLVTARLYVELATPDHAALHAAHFARNREHFARWEPPRGDVESVEYWQTALACGLVEFDQGRSVRLVVLPREMPQQLIARINFSQISRGVFQSCMLGYAIDHEYEGRGLMREALAASIDWMFGTMKLHRVQANHLLENERSARLLARLGFVREGLAREYLYINGAWRDHVLNARINPRFDASVFASARPSGTLR
jgi:ribosomal-protein-alanine N-acetyltransferase